MTDYPKPPISLALGGRFTMPSYAMHSAQAEGIAEEWYVASSKDKKRIWLYHPERADAWVSGGPGSNGCGGATVKFRLARNLGVIELVGPWCSNAGQLFGETGIDVRSNFITWGCIGTERFFDENTHQPGIGNLVYFDKEPTKGKFNRVEHLAYEMLLKNPETPLFYYSESKWGSSLGPVSKPRDLF